MSNLCFSYDYFLEEECIWVAKLSDGTTVYQDDNRPGIEPVSAWIRLGEYLKENSDKWIKEIQLKFGTHEISVAGEKDLYFYSHGLLASVTKSCGYHIIGWNTNDKEIIRVHYKKPELIITNHDKISIKSCKQGQIIRNHG